MTLVAAILFIGLRRLLACSRAHAQLSQLVAVYEARIASFATDRERFHVQANTSLRQKLRDFFAEHLRHGPGALIFATFCATAAIASFMAYDFHELSPYVLIGNPLTLAIIEFFAIPGVLIGAALYPLGLDGFVWHYVGFGIGLILWAARLIASAPGAIVHLKTFAPYALIFLSLAVLSAVIWRTAVLRATAIPLAIIGLWGATRGPDYDIAIAATGESAAVRTPDGQLSVLGARSSAFLSEQWLRADADPRAESGAERNAMRFLRFRRAIAGRAHRRFASHARRSRRRLCTRGARHRAVPGAERPRRRDNHRSASSRCDGGAYVEKSLVTSLKYGAHAPSGRTVRSRLRRGFSAARDQ
jgi:hypothetical protein